MVPQTRRWKRTSCVLWARMMERQAQVKCQIWVWSRLHFASVLRFGLPAPKMEGSNICLGLRNEKMTRFDQQTASYLHPRTGSSLLLLYPEK
ncbi:hypothetical protein MCOR27_008871 [Pyricularia oryzae]|uniref:Secreted protein n=1 Tax=Pyricularia grisea TaxID=148305 RepID=A0ABQ8N9G6_PYRGI|nr:hypothetical protein MCOR26_010264 [Pyricularia oryzae]KAI6293032.1 hypothetical protein MCOR33_009427 [Pyricularia grisea]KAI6271342.1 hypothetical protein MCOR27_008871 [Pyricularia oryzae]KAI6312011.1 hypothetical protein MCOR34_005753 [Pyricularia oryzae]KAI6329421.1 hypothetical protein MCOR30_005643 [Pyricularia oryzae]